MTIMMKNLFTGEWHWFTDGGVDRSVPCNPPGIEDTCVAVMEQDWPVEAGMFSSSENIWLIHPGY